VEFLNGGGVSIEEMDSWVVRLVPEVGTRPNPFLIVPIPLVVLGESVGAIATAE
jgi:hypothetical protein